MDGLETLTIKYKCIHLFNQLFLLQDFELIKILEVKNKKIYRTPHFFLVILIPKNWQAKMYVQSGNFRLCKFNSL